ncbi:MAG TPA: hypothetical protein VMV65_02110 [Alphaproteobacteria bacterium]|nr:hypothetical protein [Alphaproteobacteria bacterium]
MRIPALLALLLIGATPSPSPTFLPEIYHTISSPICSALKTKFRPAVAMLIQNDATIAKSPALFKDYIDFTAAGSDAGQNMAVMHLENLVQPLVQNTLAIQKMLDDPSIFPDNPQTPEEKALVGLKDATLKSLATQQASIDIINGFVDTQQLAQMQHEGMGYLASLTNNEQPGQNQQLLTDLVGATPDPTKPQLYDNLALQAGLPPNQYEIDPTTIPGLALGYNPVGKLKEGVEWTQAQNKKDEAPLANAIIATSKYCSGQPVPPPSPNP